MHDWKETIVDLIALVCIFGVGYLALCLAPGLDAAIIEMKGQ